MYYITYAQPDRYRQVSFEEMLGLIENLEPLKKTNHTGTLTKKVNEIPLRIMTMTNVSSIIGMFSRWHSNNYHRFMPQIKAFEALTQKERPRNPENGMAYYTFAIPKQNGKLRIINAPNAHFKAALSDLKDIFESVMIRSYHTSAYAYIKGRCPKNAVEYHQKWDSKWFAHYDFKDFFSNSSKDFIMKQLKKQYPFCIMNDAALHIVEECLECCMLDGGLPQGTPISPTLTNIMMIPFDHEITNVLHKYASTKSKNGVDRFVYTRYADDIEISCRVDFNYREIEQLIRSNLRELGAPFTINSEKTHYNSRAGANWMLGVMLNKDNALSVGHRQKKHFKAMTTNYILSRAGENEWDLDQLEYYLGMISYYRSIEAETIDFILNKLGDKFNCQDVFRVLVEDIKRKKGGEN